MSFFEAAMIICFGVSWPVAVWKTAKTKQVQGKSLAFIALVASGYGFGVIHKVLHNFDWLVVLYGLNFLVVLTELGLCLIYGSPHRSWLTRAPATTGNLLTEGGNREVRIQEYATHLASSHDVAERSITGDELIDIPAVIRLPAVAKARIRNRNSRSQLQKDLWSVEVGEQVH